MVLGSWTASTRKQYAVVPRTDRESYRARSCEQQSFADHSRFIASGDVIARTPVPYGSIAFVLEEPDGNRAVVVSNSDFQLKALHVIHFIQFCYRTSNPEIGERVATRGRWAGFRREVTLMYGPSLSRDCWLCCSLRGTNNAVYKIGTPHTLGRWIAGSVAASARQFQHWQRTTCLEPCIGITNSGEGAHRREVESRLGLKR